MSRLLTQQTSSVQTPGGVLRVPMGLGLAQAQMDLGLAQAQVGPGPGPGSQFSQGAWHGLAQSPIWPWAQFGRRPNFGPGPVA